MAWRRHGGTQCAKAPLPPAPSSHRPTAPAPPAALLSCGDSGGVIEKIAFASFGRPKGGCGGYKIDPHFHHPASIGIVERACVGKKACLIGAEIFGSDDAAHDNYRNDHDGDPLGVTWAAVEVQCGGGEEGVTVEVLELPSDTELTLTIPREALENIAHGELRAQSGDGETTEVQTAANAGNLRVSISTSSLRTTKGAPVSLPLHVTTMTLESGV